MTKKKIIYVVNPRSGVGKKKVIEDNILAQTDKSTTDIKIIRTTHRGHATEIAKEYRDKADIVVAVGGDGTVNEVGCGLIGSSTALGIIPCGSGNGLARELDIPLRTTMATEVVGDPEIRTIDIMRISSSKAEYQTAENRFVSLNVAGVGFDAYISHGFANKKRRGPLQYMNLIAKEFPAYEPQEYVLDIDGHIYSRKAFLISFANSSQWGNDIHIAPQARMDDGLIDVCIVSEFPNTAIPSLVISLLSQQIANNKYDEMIRSKKIELHNSEELMGHVDGEPVIFPPYCTIEAEPMALKVAVPSKSYYDAHRFNPQKLRDQVVTTVSEPLKEIRQNIRNIKTILEP